MKIRNNQDGIAHLAAILVAVVVVVIGVVGWKVWDSKGTKTKNESPATATQPTVKKADETKTTSNDKRYLEIKEYGLKIALTDGIEDAYYTIDPYPPATTAGIPYLSVHSLDEYPDCKIVAAVSKAKVGDPKISSEDLFTEEFLKSVSSFKMGEYYYWITLDKGMSCVDKSKENNTDKRETRARKAFPEAKFEKL